MKQRFGIVVVLIFVCISLAAQNKSIKRKNKKLLNEAQYYFDGGEYLNAWNNYQKVLASDANNEKAGTNGAMAISKLNYPVDSLLFLESNLTNSKLVDAKFYLAKIKHRQKLFTEAELLLEDYLRVKAIKRVHTDNEILQLKLACVNARSFIAQAHLSSIKNMGPEINSNYPDYVPVIMPDESAIYFTSKRPGTNATKNNDNQFFEDVFVSYRENGKWQKAVNVGQPINSNTNDGCVAISPDGQQMIVFRTAENIEAGDLYITRAASNNQWTELQLMSSEINSEFIETSACFSMDTAVIYFSSTRPGGFGGKDLYRIKKLPSGQWSTPFNLGPNINTASDEDAPYLHPDGVTLYFSSKGHNTMGEFDVFKTILDEETNEFSKPENLGYPINDVGNDIFFVLSVDGKRGYYSSQREETFGGLDIYQIDTRFSDNDLQVRLGTALIENLPARVKITLLEEKTESVQGTYFSNEANGKFILIVNPLKNYRVILEADDCETQTNIIKAMLPDEQEQPIIFDLKKKDAN